MFIELFEDQADKLADGKVHVLGFLGLLYLERLLANGNRKAPGVVPVQHGLAHFPWRSPVHGRKWGEEVPPLTYCSISPSCQDLLFYFPFVLLYSVLRGRVCMYLRLSEVPDEGLGWTLLFWVSS